MKVLIADDHPIVRRGLRQVLASEPDLEVVGEATNGEEALDLARRLDWDVAVFDFAMPGRSGLDLLAEVKREFPQRPVLILSIHAEQLQAARILRAGGSGYISKESAPEELTAALRKVCGGGRYVSASLAEAIAMELAENAGRPPHEALTDREYRVMWLLASGKRINEIAEEMKRSPSTVSTFRARGLHKLGLRSNGELVRYFVTRDLLA